MNITYWIAAVSISTVLLTSAASAEPQSAPVKLSVSAAPTTVTTKHRSAQTPKKSVKKKPSKKLSKATRSALESGKLKQAMDKHDAKSAPSEALASAMGRDTSEGLRESGSAPVVANTPNHLSMKLSNSGLVAADAAAPTLPIGAAELAADDQVVDLSSADVFGEQQVSVIDRFSDKPKSKVAIANGPLRLRLHDKALRASVQIPIAAP